MKNKSALLLMYAAFFGYSLSSVFTKLASREIFLSIPYILYSVGMIFILGGYAIVWQQVLKQIPLSIAMANKPLALFFSILWARFLFGEKMSMKAAIGLALILCGVFIIGWFERGR